MNAFNRFVMLVIALVLVVVPVLLLLVALGVISAGAADQYTGYGSGLQALDGMSVSALGGGISTITAVVGVVVALLALLLLLRELKFWGKGVRNVVIDDTPGEETRLSSAAATALVEGAAREAGAESPKASLSPAKRSYGIACTIEAPASSDYTELAARARENIRRTLESHNVALKDVEVTVRGTAQ